MDNTTTTLITAKSPVDCACVIHGDAYSWTYVERLYNMLNRHISCGIRLHVYTEAERPVPAPMIKHALSPWGISGPRHSWWYKIQLFNPEFHAGPLLYFDLDTVIVNNIDWICDLPLTWFWTVRDFKYLWRPATYNINSSIMWWDTKKFDYVWKDFQEQNLQQLIKLYRGDQDYLMKIVKNNEIRYLNSERIKSWRWECFDGGYIKKPKYQQSNVNAMVPQHTDILVFHGHPKPDKIQDPIVIQNWK